MYALPHELPNGLNLTILGNYETSRKSLKILELKASDKLATRNENLTVVLENCKKKLISKTFNKNTSFT